MPSRLRLVFALDLRPRRAFQSVTVWDPRERPFWFDDLGSARFGRSDLFAFPIRLEAKYPRSRGRTRNRAIRTEDTAVPGSRTEDSPTTRASVDDLARVQRDAFLFLRATLWTPNCRYDRHKPLVRPPAETGATAPCRLIKASAGRRAVDSRDSRTARTGPTPAPTRQLPRPSNACSRSGSAAAGGPQYPHETREGSRIAVAPSLDTTQRILTRHGCIKRRIRPAPWRRARGNGKRGRLGPERFSVRLRQMVQTSTDDFSHVPGCLPTRFLKPKRRPIFLPPVTLAPHSVPRWISDNSLWALRRSPFWRTWSAVLRQRGRC